MSKSDKTCPICYDQYCRDSFILKDSIQNSDFNSTCNHWFCVGCLRSLVKVDGKIKCPLCRSDLTEWYESHYEEDSQDED